MLFVDLNTKITLWNKKCANYIVCLEWYAKTECERGTVITRETNLMGNLFVVWVWICSRGQVNTNSIWMIPKNVKPIYEFIYDIFLLIFPTINLSTQRERDTIIVVNAQHLCIVFVLKEVMDELKPFMFTICWHKFWIECHCMTINTHKYNKKNRHILSWNAFLFCTITILILVNCLLILSMNGIANKLTRKR